MPIGELSALTAAASWAVGSLLFARIGRRVAPGAMNLGKCVAAAIVLSLARLALAPSLGGVAWSSEAAVPLALSGVIGLTLGDTAYFGAIATLGVPRAILLLSCAPVFAALGGAVFMNEHLDTRAVLGMAITLAGIVVVVSGRVAAPPAVLASDAPPRLRRGVVLGVLASLGQAGGSLLSRKAMLLGLDPLGAAAGRLIAGASGLVLASLLTGHARPWSAALMKDFSWAKVAGAALIGTCGGIWLSQIALARCSSTGVASTLLATSPIFVLPLAHFSGQERITVRGVLGTLVAISGVVLLSLRA